MYRANEISKLMDKIWNSTKKYKDVKKRKKIYVQQLLKRLEVNIPSVEY
ncbi:hypothetical protein [Deferribacter abyssi]